MEFFDNNCNENVQMFSIQKDDMVGVKEAKKVLGFSPQRITDYIGLAGDKTDNIPGVHSRQP